MALYDTVTSDNFFTLLRLGFTARLRWELSDTFLAASPTLSRTESRADAALFHFHTEQLPTKSSTLVVLQTPDNSNFLSLTPAPSLSSSASLLRLTLHTNNPRRTLISLQPPPQNSPYLTLRPSPTTTTSFSKHCLFHLEILPSSIGKPPTAPIVTRHLSPAQAATHALLALGVRFRIRSVHSRVLRVSSSDGAKLAAVLQNGPATRLDEANDAELLLTAFLRGGVPPRGDAHPRAQFTLQHTATERNLAVSADVHARARRETLDDTSAILVPEKEGNTPPILVQYADEWGVLHLGRAAANAQEREQWLMAGRHGRLELRSHRGHWESFRVEFVTQSLQVALKELPKSSVYDAASEATKAAMRKQIMRKVAEARKETGETAINGKAVGKNKDGKQASGFNHSAALGGLSDAPQSAKKTAKAPAKKAPVSGGKGASAIKAKDKAAAKAAATAAASALPRNKANRKAAKRNKKKQGKAAQKSKPAAAKSVPAASRPKPPTEDASVKAAESGSGASAQSGSPADTASSSSAVAGSSGPPCAACGRIIEGTYTTALGKNFHPQCFCCGKCRRPMGVGGGQFRERGGIPYCHPCYAAHLASRCARCSKPIMETVVTAMDKTWHKECLTCTICRLPLTQTFWLYADRPNEPRCARCVTGSEDGLGRPRGNGRMVNLPGFGPRKNGPGVPLAKPASAPTGPGQPGRARLLAPMLPATTRR